LQAKVLEYWSPTPLPEGDPGKDAAAPAELRQLAKEEIEFSFDSSVGSESEVEITKALGLPPSAAPRRKMHRAVKKISLSKAGLAAAQQSLRSSTRSGTSKVWGALAPPATAEVGSASASPQAEKVAVQGLGQLRGEVTPPDTSSGAQPAAPLKLKFSLRRWGG
jgi:hypothetical protein